MGMSTNFYMKDQLRNPLRVPSNLTLPQPTVTTEVTLNLPLATPIQEDIGNQKTAEAKGEKTEEDEAWEETHLPAGTGPTPVRRRKPSDKPL